MDIYQRIIKLNLVNDLSNLLKDKTKSENIHYKITPGCIMFFIGESSILSIIPNMEEKLTYANNPKYQEEVKEALLLIEKIIIREEKLNEIIKKES